MHEASNRSCAQQENNHIWAYNWNIFKGNSFFTYYYINFQDQNNNEELELITRPFIWHSSYTPVGMRLPEDKAVPWTDTRSNLDSDDICIASGRWDLIRGFSCLAIYWHNFLPLVTFLVGILLPWTRWWVVWFARAEPFAASSEVAAYAHFVTLSCGVPEPHAKWSYQHMPVKLRKVLESYLRSIVEIKG